MQQFQFRSLKLTAYELLLLKLLYNKSTHNYLLTYYIECNMIVHMFNRKIIEYLKEWSRRDGRKPLVMRGARQVGKTSAVLILAEKCFKSIIHINLEKAEHSRLFRNEISLDEFLMVIQAEFKQAVVAGETLIFIDEIQNSPYLIKLLRFFYEERPDLHVIAAGSLLEAKIEKEGFSFPVGRIEFCYIYPLDFFEYLEAKNETELLRILREIKLDQTIPTPIHEMALKIFYEYAMIGGMPEIVSDYTKNKDINRVKTLFASLLTGYMEDVFKYASQAEAKYLSYIIETAPLFAGTHITYEKFGGSNFRSREMSKAFSLLEKTMLLYQVRSTQSKDLPLIPKEKKAKKLIYLDIGLVNYRMNIINEYLGIVDFDKFYQGRLAEQIAAQNLLSLFVDVPAEIFYWARDKGEGNAKVDFCINYAGQALGIEVKSGKTGRLKSLAIFSGQNPKSRLMRVYSGKLIQENIQKSKLLSLPFYLLPRLLEFADTRNT
ncbi:MAG: hypothetical protein FD145_608 [Candidatus Saganbacteria bacterium]|uniref:ATP-binding protein n=1 Tax=Candidatus Saganbacteria bacterium TaxID=2575572 RepID=A0A833L1P4_UNCSA|nr:MAG: hypothetical protein FD145_608 [Candidatus Saganbacteria bacterium]